MRFKNVLSLIGLMAALVMLIPCSQALADGGPEPPPEGAIFMGPEIWGVVVVRCHPTQSDFGAVRVKRVVDCDVQTQGLGDPAWPLGCPPDAAGATGHTLPVGTTFWDIEGTPYINKVKNFKSETDPNDANATIVSFDAQFKFWKPGP